MHADGAAVETMEPLPHEISERELEMREPSESIVCWEELRVAREEVEKRLSIEESGVEYQHELWSRHYYEYYNDEGNTFDEGNTEDEDVTVLEFNLGDAESSTSGMLSRQVMNISSKIGEA
ncbi:hypothetical protein ZWY2020_040273 [Hordeum vulgare]|nr:hypothetical protein ZWY2020_040273 [Hordeum vulgare]